MALDVGDEAATVALIDDVERSFGPIDLWFANAGLTGGGSADEPNAAWDAQWRVNVMAHVFTARCAAARLDRARRGTPDHHGIDGRDPDDARHRRGVALKCTAWSVLDQVLLMASIITG